MKHDSKKWDEMVGFGSIAASEIILGNILFVYPVNLSLFYFSKSIGSILIGLGSDSLKRKTALYVTLSICGFFSFTAFSSNWLAGMIPVSFSLVMIGLLGDPSIVSRAVLLDVHIHEIYNDRLKCKGIMAQSVRVECVVWIFISVISYTFALPINYFLIFGSGLSLGLIILLSFVHDQTHPDKRHAGVKGMIKECLGVSLLGGVFLSFLCYSLLTEVSFFSFFFNVEQACNSLYEKATSAMSWSVAMYVGSFLHENILKHIKERKVICLGFAISIIGFFMYMITYLMADASLIRTVYLTSFAVVGLGSGIFLPCLYSISTSFGRIHVFGLLIGMIDLIRTLGEWVGSIFGKKSVFSFSMWVACSSTFIVCMCLIHWTLKKKESSSV